MRNLSRLTWAANNLAAWQDWNYYESCAVALGVTEEQIAELRPKKGSSWRVVDKQLPKLRELVTKKTEEKANAKPSQG